MTREVMDFDPKHRFAFIDMVVFIFCRDPDKRLDWWVAIAHAVWAGLEDFSYHKTDAEGDATGEETLAALLAPVRSNPILAKLQLDLLHALAKRLRITDSELESSKRQFIRCFSRSDTSMFALDFEKATPGELELELRRRALAGNEMMLTRIEPFSALMPQITSAVEGYPMLAALGLILFCSALDANGKPKRTLNQIRASIREKVKAEGRKPALKSQIDAWTRYKSVLPLLAGFLAVAAPWRPASIIDRYRVGSLILQAIADDESRMRALRYAAWFTEQATTRRTRARTGPYLIAPEEVAQIGVRADLPALPPWLAEVI